LSSLSDEQRAVLREETVEDMLRLGPLEPLIADDSVTEIMVIDYQHIFVERKGRLTLTERNFRDPGHLIRVIERIVTPVGRRIDESSPLVDARLADGSRVNAVIPPITPDGACLTIRKFGKSLFTLEKLISFKSLTTEMSHFIEASVALRKNVIVSGGTGSGKTSLLNAISLCIGNDERIVTIEDSLELKLQQKHVVRMEARPDNAEGKGGVSIRALVRNSLRMRPDRIVVGECRGGEALDMLQAMNTGHDGSLTTVHANTPRDTVARLETLCLMAGMDLPLTAIRSQIVSAVNLIVQTARLSDGSRKVTAISEVLGLDERGLPLLHDLFVFQQTGVNTDTRKVLGGHHVVGRPSYLKEFALRGIPLDERIFDGVTE
ncbi:MAG: CpaF family protein, partial [Kiritimatiellia bacterium]